MDKLIIVGKKKNAFGDRIEVIDAILNWRTGMVTKEVQVRAVKKGERQI